MIFFNNDGKPLQNQKMGFKLKHDKSHRIHIDGTDGNTSPSAIPGTLVAYDLPL